MRPINLVTIVDDDDVYSFVERKIIEETNLSEKIKIFSNGLDALSYIKLNSHNAPCLPEIILLDLNMPIMDGFQFLEEFAKIKAELDKKINIFVVSSSVSQVEIDKINAINDVSHFIIKPITKEIFEKMVEALTEKTNSVST